MTNRLKDRARDVGTTDAVVDDVKMAGENANGDGAMEDADDKLRNSDVGVKQVEN